MSDSRVLCSHVLTVRFDQLEDNSVNWYVQPDEQVQRTYNISLVELAERGAPMAAMGIRILWKLCVDGLVVNALEQANDIQAEIVRRMRAADGVLPESIPDDVTIN